VAATIDAQTLTAPARSASQPLISLPFLLLRGFSTTAIVVTALIQIYVFARVMSPQTFSIFILVGAVGYSLWLCDLGAVKFLFVRLRSLHLSGRRDQTLVAQCTAVVTLYALLSIAGTIVCFIGLAALPAISAADALTFALFFLFTALNLTWYALRNLSIAIDDFVFFESIEAVRRTASIGVMVLMLAGLSVAAFVVVVNLLWALALAIAVARLVRKNVVTADWRGSLRSLWPFYLDNRRDLVRTATSNTSDFYIENLPYLVVPVLFGLGAPTVILDAVFKFVRGANLCYHAIGDLVLPRQTAALAQRDSVALIRATLLALLLAFVPTAIIAAALLVAAEPFFKLLLGPAATMPAEAVWVIIVLLFSTMIQVLFHSLLLHSGFFREAARAMGFTAAAITLIPAISLVQAPTIASFLGWYAAAFALGALLQIVLAIRGPVRAARAA
jgi:O-antigen/teichoic acid export membrane protein